MNRLSEGWNEILRLSSDIESGPALKSGLSGRSVAIFGAGPHGLAAARYLEQMGAMITCFVDNDPAKQGTLFHGCSVVSPQDEAVGAASITFIAVRREAVRVREQLLALGRESLFFDAFFFASHRERFAHVRNNLFCDDRSRLSYDGIVKTILTGQSSHCAAVMEGHQYFALPEFVHIGNDHFVDAGAYVGDTIERFLWVCSGVFSRIYAFEPGQTQMTAMAHRLDRLRREWAFPSDAVVCEQAGLADRTRKLTAEAPGILARTSLHAGAEVGSDSAAAVQCYDLDTYLDGRPATFIKADIEGMELEMLRGAKETIKRYKPKMALSIYHTASHLFEIAEAVHDLMPEYRMALRQHSPVFAETILYCWVPREG